MKTLFLALTIVGLIAAPVHAQTVIFHDDFDGTVLDASKWNVGTWTLGRTHLGSDPVVAGGIARLTFDTYGFKGTEIWSDAWSVEAQPDPPTYVRLNLWAPCIELDRCVRRAGLKPARRARDNVRYYYDVDWVEVRQLP